MLQLQGVTMPIDRPRVRIAVIGAGIAGAACAGALQRCGVDVTVFDKSRGIGGRMSTRRVVWAGQDGTERTSEFDHGAQHFTAPWPRFRAMLQRAERAGCVAPWQANLHSSTPGVTGLRSHVAVPNMPALARHLLDGVPLRLERAVQRLQRGDDGWQVVLAGGDVAGPYHQVVLAMPPAQAAVLLAGHHDGWADALSGVEMLPCWTLMAVTDELDWPWDAAEPPRGPLAWIARNDRKPGRTTTPGYASWVAQATPAWSRDHADAEPRVVATLLQSALARLLPRQRAGAPLAWHHTGVHRWRYAVPASGPANERDERDFWWDAELGLGVCGDFLSGGRVEGAWRSGDELADTLAAWLEQAEDETEDEAAAEAAIAARPRAPSAADRAVV
jgi:predicted NAD/FAD-dependent oxidoreductase